MSLVSINRRFVSVLTKHRRYVTSSLPNEDEYTATPNYPEILDLSPERLPERKKQMIADEVKAVKTVEEKQIKLNMPRYYGFTCYLLKDDQVPYDNLRFTQHITRTHLIEQDGLPSFYNSFNIEDVGDIKQALEDVLLLEYDGYKKVHQINETSLDEKDEENLRSSLISKHINRICLNKLHTKYPHLLNTQTDIDTRIESSWYVGGMIPTELVKRSRRGLPWSKDRENEPIDRCMQYLGKANLTLRTDHPLPPIVPYQEACDTSLDVPFFKYDPHAVGIFTERRRIVNVPGFWPGDINQFGLISYQGRGHMLERKERDDQDDKEAIHRQGILASFGWLSAQANFLGFTTYNDITYPLVTQCVITNGQLWSFYVYQLNTMLLHSNNSTVNPKRNICWATKELKLYEDIQDGKVIGLNEDVLKILLQFYANAPQQCNNVELRPYLSDKEKIIADYEDDDKRRWLEKEYKFIVSNRPRYQVLPEIYAWEKIYKIDNKTRPMDARKRPFELRIDPYKRTYDSRLPEYIPRKHRPDLPRHKGRYVKEYFP